MDKILHTLRPYYLNSKDYFSKDWRYKEECSVYSNRKLCEYECVADFDGITLEQRKYILEWFFERNFIFALYASSDTGCHVHFFTPFNNKYQKKEIIKLLELEIGIKIDSGPVTKGWIRAEGSIHPVKGNIKQLIYSNIPTKAYLSPLFYTNNLSYSTTRKVSKISTTGVQNTKKETEEPYSIEYMKKTRFADGRKRILFALVSWWVSRGYDKQIVSQKAKDWCRAQEFRIHPVAITAVINSNRGLVRDSYRLELLKELGHNIMKEQDVVPKGSYSGF